MSIESPFLENFDCKPKDLSAESPSAANSSAQATKETAIIFIGYSEIPLSFRSQQEKILINTGECEKSLSSFIKILSLIVDEKEKIVKVNPFDFEMVELFGSSHFELKNVDDKLKLFNALIEQTLAQSKFQRILHRVRIDRMNLDFPWFYLHSDLRTVLQLLRKSSSRDLLPSIEGTEEKNLQLLKFLGQSNFIRDNLKFVYDAGSPFTSNHSTLVLSNKRRRIRRIKALLKGLDYEERQISEICKEFVDITRSYTLNKHLIDSLAKKHFKFYFSNLTVKIGNNYCFDLYQTDDHLLASLKRSYDTTVKNNTELITLVALVRTSPKRRLVMTRYELEENSFVQIFVNDHLFFEDNEGLYKFETNVHRWPMINSRLQIEDRLMSVNANGNNFKKLCSDLKVKPEHWNPHGWNVLKFKTTARNIAACKFTFEFWKDHILEPRVKKEKVIA